jgi:hypothetical protein
MLKPSNERSNLATVRDLWKRMWALLSHAGSICFEAGETVCFNKIEPFSVIAIPATVVSFSAQLLEIL